MKEFAAAAKANTGKYTYGSSRLGGASHLASELFWSMAGLDMTHVPYKDGALAATDMLGGRLTFIFAKLTTARPHIRCGKLRALGIGTENRSIVMRVLPTITENGAPCYEANNCKGVVPPRAMPRTVVDRLQRDIATIVAPPDIREKLLDAAFEPINASMAILQTRTSAGKFI